MKLPKKLKSNWYYINRLPILLLTLTLLSLLCIVELLLNLINLL